MKRLGWLALAAVALGTFFGGGWLLRRGLEVRRVHADGTGAPTAMTNRLFQDVVRHVRSYAVDSLADSAIYRLAARGMLSELGDPYAAIVPERREDGPLAPRAASALGMFLDLDGDLVSVVAVVPGGPAALAGVRAGDAVLEVGGGSTEGRRPEDVAAHLAAAPPGEVELRLGRPGAGSLRVRVAAGAEAAAPEPTVADAAGGVLNLRVGGLARGTAALVADLIEQGVGRGARGVVLDLRGVVGGDPEHAAALAGLFLPQGAPVALIRGREPGNTTSLVVDREPRFAELPLVVLVDRGTAGAAELVAGALQDGDRGLVIGEPSFGRGVSVSHFPLGDGSSLRLTTALWQTPSGRVIQRPAPEPHDTTGAEERPEHRTAGNRVVWGGGGIVPDREVELASGDAAGEPRDPALALARQLLARARNTKGLLSLDTP